MTALACQWQLTGDKQYISTINIVCQAIFLIFFDFFKNFFILKKQKQITQL